MRVVSQFARTVAGLASCLWLPIAAQAAPPAAPQVTTGADIKLLRFDWNYVPRANTYELWLRANAGAAPARFSETPSSRPRAINNVSAHLLDWAQARYFVKACNPSGCTSSAEIPVDDLVFDALGYFKSGATQAGAAFGDALALSEDGKTMAVVARSEKNPLASNVRNIVLYVFTKTADGRWAQQARLRPDPDEVENGEEPSVSLSGGGNVLALGLPLSRQIGRGTTESGGVFVFRRNGGAWSQEALLQHDPGELYFGFRTQIDEAGDTIKAGFGGNGRIRVFDRGATGWTRTGQIEGIPGRNCEITTMSGDGKTIARACPITDAAPQREVQIFTAPAWSLAATRQTDSDSNLAYTDIASDYSANVIVTAEMPEVRQPDNRRWVRWYFKGDGSYSQGGQFFGPWQQW